MALPTIPEAPPLFDVPSLCQRILTWSETTEDIGLLSEVKARLSAFDAYLQTKDADMAVEVERTQRLLEVRIGVLLGKATRDHDRRPGAKSGVTDIGLSRHERNEFRKMASHKGLVNKVLRHSNAKDPPSRKKVLRAIKSAAEPPPAKKPPLAAPKPEKPEAAARRRCRETLVALTSDLLDTIEEEYEWHLLSDNEFNRLFGEWQNAVDLFITNVQHQRKKR